MKWRSNIKKRSLACMCLCSFVFLCPARAQQMQTFSTSGVEIKDVHQNNYVPLFTERESTVGTPFLVKNWSAGYIEFTNHKMIPEKEKLVLFNFDKINFLLFSIDTTKKITTYSPDSVSSFSIMDQNSPIMFEKVSCVSNSFFLIPVIKSNTGYSLYKRLFTRLIESEYQNAGYYSTGKKYNEYIDYYEYYLIFPGNTEYRKLFLNEKKLRRALKNESVLMSEFFASHDSEQINEDSMLALVQYIDDQKYPE